MRLIRDIGRLLPVAAFIAMLPPSALVADELGGSWVSHPRSLITIVIREDGGRISGPGWEQRFEAGVKDVDFEIAPGRRLVLRLEGDVWVGEYFHPRIRPGDHVQEAHKVLFVREKIASR